MWTDADAVEAYLSSGQMSGVLGATVLAFSVVALVVRALKYATRSV